MRPDQRLPAAIDRVLDGLPASYLVAHEDDARLVVGPTGAVVLVPTPARGPGLDDAATLAHDLAGRTRTALCEHLTIVPFLDTMLVARHRAVRHPDVAVASVDILGVALTEGTTVIDPAALTAITLAVRGGRLNGWKFAAEQRGARIDLCDPTSPAPAPTSAA